MEVQMDLEKIAEALFIFIPEMNPDEQKLSLSLYNRLALGKPVTTADLADEAAVSIKESESFLKERFGVYADEKGNVIGYLGLATLEMRYRLYTKGKQLYTWCAWDGLFIPPLLGEKADIETKDPNTGKKIEISVAVDGSARSDSGDVVMSVLIPNVSEEEFAEDIISSFCHHVYFFESRESALEFIASKEEQYVILSLDDAVKLSRMWNGHVHGQVLPKGRIATL